MARGGQRPKVDAELLMEHVLDVAAANGLLRISKHGHYITVRDVSVQLRRLISGALPR